MQPTVKCKFIIVIQATIKHSQTSSEIMSVSPTDSRVGVDSSFGSKRNDFLLGVNLLGLVINAENHLAFLLSRHAL